MQLLVMNITKRYYIIQDILASSWKYYRLLRITLLQNIATDEFAESSPIRTVVAADFNNDGNLEVN